MMLSICVTADGHVAPTDVPAPTPRPDQAVIAVRASSVNRGELALIAARGAGWHPGQDVSGVVLEPAADGSGPVAGARVAGLAEQGAWSEVVVATASRLAVIPDGVDFATAATLPIEQIEPADAALDSVGGEVLGGVIGRLKPNAPVVWFGSSAGRPAQLSIYDFIGHENLKILTYFSYAADDSRDADDLASLLRLVDQGHLTSTVADTWGLEDADAAIRQLASGGIRGKIVLDNGADTTATTGS